MEWPVEELVAIACIADGFGWVFQWAFVAQDKQQSRNCPQLNMLLMVAMAMTFIYFIYCLFIILPHRIGYKYNRKDTK